MLKRLKNHFSLAAIQYGATGFTLFWCLINLIGMNLWPHHWLLFSIAISFASLGIALASSALMSDALSSISENAGSATSLIQLMRTGGGMLASFSMSFFLVGSVKPMIYQQLIFVVLIAVLLVLSASKQQIYQKT